MSNRLFFGRAAPAADGPDVYCRLMEPSETSTAERWEVRFHGHVQGVGFRFTTRDVASRFAVVGFVENLVDGRVRLVAEGTAGELRRFVDAVASTLERRIEGYERETLAASGEFMSFEIRR